MTREQPGSPTAFESLVEDYDAARPGYPAALYAQLPPLAGLDLLELGAGTGKATAGLLDGARSVVCTDLGPRMLGRLHARHPGTPAAVARAEALPFRDASFDGVCGAQMWHWLDAAAAAAEAWRVLRPGGWLALWWNEVDADGLAWWDAQQDRLEAGNPRYHRGYRERDYGAELEATGLFGPVATWSGQWSRQLDLAMYERWLRSKSYVQELPDVEEFVATERASLAAVFPDGLVTEPFAIRLWLAHRVGR